MGLTSKRSTLVLSFSPDWSSLKTDNSRNGMQKHVFSFVSDKLKESSMQAKVFNILKEIFGNEVTHAGSL